jgi:Cytochrome c7 and related cytochrome c
MAALFPPRSNRIAARILGLALALLVIVPAGAMFWVRSPAVTGQGRGARQPLPFDHRLHVAGFRIDCRYCHQSADREASAGLPPTATCVPCHSAVWLAGPIFAPVRRSLATDRPIPWRRVNQLPDFVFFNHAIHLRGGIGCETCHGRVDRMAEVRQSAPLTMGWCVDCHRNPEPSRRPDDAITSMGWHPVPSTLHPAALDPPLRRELTTCSACHR